MEPALWIAQARAKLLADRKDGCAWGYRPGTEPAVEATALAALALKATAPNDDQTTSQAILEAGRWLTKQQNKDGSLGVRPGLTEPGWATPQAILVWSATGEFQAEQRRALAWLVETEGTRIPRQKDEPTSHDSMIPGWPWVTDTHSWLEPTSMSVLALRRRGLLAHPRVEDGLKLIRNRALPKGGWNYGNTVVFGAELRAQPAPTGLALIATANTGPTDAIVDQAAAYLLEILPETQAASSLGWGVLGLKAWSKAPQEADHWLEKAAEILLRPNPKKVNINKASAANPWRLAHLLLASAGTRSLDLLGAANLSKENGS